MKAANRYRARAAELRAEALQAPNETAAAELENLARAYIRLADQAEQNTLADVWVEFGPKPTLDSEA